jgi:hypothetical protein
MTSRILFPLKSPPDLMAKGMDLITDKVSSDFDKNPKGFNLLYFMVCRDPWYLSAYPKLYTATGSGSHRIKIYDIYNHLKLQYKTKTK